MPCWMRLGKVLRDAAREPAEVGLFLHGTTLATNALIERRGARTALLTTEGHRDALEMAFENRFEQYDVNIDRPAPLVPRHLRLPIRERLAADGEVLIPLDASSVSAAIDRLAEEGVESVAIGFLHGYRKADHEQAVAEAVRERLPGAAVTLACEVCPEIREFERLSTACANAYVQPLMASYLQSLEKPTDRARRALPDIADDLRRRVERSAHGRPASRSGWSNPALPAGRYWRRISLPGAPWTRCCHSTWAAPPPRSA